MRPDERVAARSLHWTGSEVKTDYSTILIEMRLMNLKMLVEMPLTRPADTLSPSGICLACCRRPAGRRDAYWSVVAPIRRKVYRNMAPASETLAAR